MESIIVSPKKKGPPKPGAAWTAAKGRQLRVLMGLEIQVTGEGHIAAG